MELSDAQVRRETADWFPERNKPNWLHRQIISMLKCGKIPKHVAFIMDGNRRYAKKEHIDRQHGHMAGFDKLSETLEWCLDVGINEVTVYAFSIENFKRSEDEVHGLLQLLKVKLEDLIKDRDKLEEQGVCVRVLGNVSLLPEELQHLVANVVSMTSSFNRAFLNVCLAYTSREEMTSSIKLVADGLSNDELEEEDVDCQLIESCLYSAASQPVDLVLRTSGEVRLSDFLLWQSSYTMLMFVKVLWPDFNRWDLYGAVLLFQQHYKQLEEIKQCHSSLASRSASPEINEDARRRKEAFLDGVNERKKEFIDGLVTK